MCYLNVNTPKYSITETKLYIITHELNMEKQTRESHKQKKKEGKKKASTASASRKQLIWVHKMQQITINHTNKQPQSPPPPKKKPDNNPHRNKIKGSVTITPTPPNSIHKGPAFLAFQLVGWCFMWQCRNPNYYREREREEGT